MADDVPASASDEPLEGPDRAGTPSPPPEDASAPIGPDELAALAASLADTGDDGGDDTVGLLNQEAIDALFGAAPTSPGAQPQADPMPEAEPVRAEGVRRPRAGGRPQRVGDLDLLAGVVLVLTAEVGRTEMTIEEVMKLRPGSLVELDKLAGEPVELYVHNQCVARGEVVVVDDNFGIRITELATSEG